MGTARALPLIDIQARFDAPVRGARNNPDAEARAARLAGAVRGAGAPVIDVRREGRGPASSLSGPDAPVAPASRPGGRRP